MKTTLKRGEIVEKLKKILDVRSIEIVRQSIIEGSKFYRIYVLLVRYVQNEIDFFQVICVVIHFGWIQLEIGAVDTVSGKAEKLYLYEVRSQSDFIYSQFQF